MLHFTEKNILLIILIFCSGLLYSQTATITLNSENQVIRGFGGINHPEWYSDLNAAERELAFGNGAGQLGLTVLRTYVSENTNNWGLGIQTAQYAYNQGAYVFASPWNPPAEMTITVDGVKRINPASFSAYAEHLNSYVTYMRNQGVELYAISTQNEPDYAHDWTEWSPQESVDFIKAYADRIDCRLMSPESFQYRKDVYDPILNDPAALANVDIFGAHLYGTQYADFPYPLFEQKGAGKELWMTEVYTDSQYDANLWNDGIINQDQHALKVAEHIHYAMVDGNFQTYVFWPIRRYYALIHDGNADGNGNTPAAAGTATKRGYCMAQFSKWVRPGYIRVDATKSPSTNVFVSAYKKDSDVVIVVVNKNTSTQSLTLDIPGTQVSSWEQYTTSATKNISQGNTINAGSSFQVTLDAASITTFVGNVQAGIPTVEITGPQENEQFIAPATIPVTSTATDSDGTIEHVDFYLNNETTPFHEEWTAPYDFNWDVPQAGTYQLRAVAYDNEGNSSEDIISIQVNIPQGPYNGTISTIPGTIEFENFDVGGNGFAYYDVDAGTNVDPAPDFRTDEDVDIETCTDTDGGYNIGYTMAGEWLEYTVNVATSGTYDITFRVACEGDNRTISLDSDGTLLAENVAIPNTGGWQVWTDVTIENVELQAGEQILRLTIGETDYVNLNYMSFSLQEEPPLTFELTSGWNLIGCPLEGSTNIETALQSVWDYVDMVKDMNGFYMKSNQAELNSLNELSWGKGYLIYVNQDCELIW
jgi:glucuronoarabinoxylan endo-1,4-beta-xylanase